MACGTDCPYEGAYQRLAARIDRLYAPDEGARASRRGSG